MRAKGKTRKECEEQRQKRERRSAHLMHALESTVTIVVETKRHADADADWLTAIVRMRFQKVFIAWAGARYYRDWNWGLGRMGMGKYKGDAAEEN